MKFSKPFDWAKCAKALMDADAGKLAEERRYSPIFIAWAVAHNLLGIFANGCVAFPVHDENGEIVACHYRRVEDKNWRYHPTGSGTRPLVIGSPKNSRTVLAFESQWDAFAVMDKLGWHTANGLPDTSVVITRGALNGKLITGHCSPNAKVYAFVQNDRPHGEAKQTPAEQWLAATAASCGCTCIRVATPPAYKDVNDWTRAGATAEDIQRVLAEGQPVHIPAPLTLSSRERILGNARFETDAVRDTDDEDKLPPFPLDALPPTMGPIVSAVSRCERVPLALPGVCALAMVSAALGAGLEVLSRPGRPTGGNLYFVASAESGSGKSECFRIVAAPLLDHQARALEVWRDKIGPKMQSEIAVLVREINTLEKKAAKAIDQQERDRLIGMMEYSTARKEELARRASPPCLIAQDATVEKLAVLLHTNREVLCSFSADARKIIDNIQGRYSANGTTDESLYLSAYSRDFVRVDRQSREPVILHKPCLTLCWFIQPDMMATILGEQSLSASGFLPRLLLCHTNATPQKIEANPPSIPITVKEQWARFIATLISSFHGAEKPYQIQPTAEAQRLLDDFHNRIVDRRQGDLADLGSYAARYAEQAWRVSVVLHAGLHGSAAGDHPLGPETAANALRIVEYFIAQQLDMLARGRRQAQDKVEAEVLELLERTEQKRGRDHITARDVHHARIVSTPEAARALLASMDDEGQIVGEDVTPERGGRATRIYRSLATANPVPG